jgi:Mannosyltransferase (PIG-V)
MTAWPFVIAVWAASRLFFFAFGAAASRIFDHADAIAFRHDQSGPLTYWAHWDGAWYSAIADDGYFTDAATAFFPLYPHLVSAGTAIAGEAALWGVIVSTVSLLFALYFVYRIAESQWGVPIARTSTLAIAFFPTAFFLNAVYTEGLFLALTTGSLWAVIVRRSFFLACLLAYFATLTRNVGVLLIVPLAFELMRQRQRPRWPGVVTLLLIPAALGAYLFFMWRSTGDPLLFVHQQGETWQRELTNPLTTISDAWSTAREGVDEILDPGGLLAGSSINSSFAASFTFDLLFFVLLAALLIGAFVFLPASLSLYSLLVMLPGLLTPSSLGPLSSVPRFMLAAFPLFFVLGRVLSANRVLLVAWLLASAATGAYLTALFTTWRWVA